MTKGKKIISIIFKVIKAILIAFLIMILGIVLVQKVSNNKAHIMGIGIYTVITESMLPTYEVGDMIFAVQVEENELKVGDDVVYQGEVDDFKGKVITHRIVEIDGKTIHTKGINNSIEDPTITYKQIYGKVVYKFGLFSIFSKLMNDTVLFYVVIFVPFTILVFLDIKDIIEERRKDKDDEDEEEDNSDKKKIKQEEEPVKEEIQGEVKEENNNNHGEE